MNDTGTGAENDGDMINMQKDDDKPYIGYPEVEDFLDWMGSPEGQLSIDVLDNVWYMLEEVDVDAVKRKLIWPDGVRLSIDESVQRVHSKFSEFPPDVIEAHLVGWLEQEFEPEGYTQAQWDEFEDLVGKWVDDHQGQISGN